MRHNEDVYGLVLEIGCLPFWALEHGIFIDFIRFIRVSFGNICTRKALGHCFLKLDVSLRSKLFPGREFEDFHRLHLFWALELRDFYSFHQTFWTFFRRWGISKVLGVGFLKLNANWIFIIYKKYSTSYGSSKLPYGLFIVLHKINCVVSGLIIHRK